MIERYTNLRILYFALPVRSTDERQSKLDLHGQVGLLHSLAPPRSVLLASKFVCDTSDHDAKCI